MSTDKRVVKTKTSIRNAFMELSLEKDISKISVSDLTAKATINRSTFYLHYGDIRSVADDIDNVFSETISSCIGNFDINDLYGSAYSMFNHLTEAVDNDLPMKRYIIFSKNSQAIAERLKSIFAEKALEALKAFFPEFDRENAYYPVTFAAAGIIDCYFNWARSGENIPLEKLISQLSEITDHIFDAIK